MTPGTFAKARLGQHVTFGSPQSPLMRPQQCFTPSYSRTSAVSSLSKQPPALLPLTYFVLHAGFGMAGLDSGYCIACRGLDTVHCGTLEEEGEWQV